MKRLVMLKLFIFLFALELPLPLLAQSVLGGHGSLPPPVPRRGGGAPSPATAAPAPFVDGMAAAPQGQVTTEGLAPLGSAPEARRRPAPPPAVVNPPREAASSPRAPVASAPRTPAPSDDSMARGGNQRILIRGTLVDSPLPSRRANARYQLQVIGYRMVSPQETPIELINMLNPTDPNWRRWRPDPRDYIRRGAITPIDTEIVRFGYCVDVQRQGNVIYEGQSFPRFGVVRFVRPSGC